MKELLPKPSKTIDKQWKHCKKQEILLYLLQRFNDYEVPIQMGADDVRELLTEFIDEYKE